MGEKLDKITKEYFAPKGFSDPAKAASNLRLISEGADERLLKNILPPLVHHCSISADPDACLNNFERVSAAFEKRDDFINLLAERPEGIKILSHLFAQARFLVRFMLSEPERLINWLTNPETLASPPDRETIRRSALKLCPPDTPLPEASAILRKFKYAEFLRITARDLLGISGIPETTLELSNLADAVLEAAVRIGRHELDKKYGAPLYYNPLPLVGEGGAQRRERAYRKLARCPFAVIAMGKLGGRELNFSSDIDIIFVYGGDGNTEGARSITNHQYFVELSEIIVKLIGEKTSDGFVFRVDTRLRPEGERGDLAQSLAGYETYYESWGRVWERSALIKARPCAGDMELGREFLEAVRPFVFRKYLDYSAIAEIREMKLRIEKSSLNDTKEYNVKLGSGGIREIEFFISILQLVYGGRMDAIREKNSLRALHRLANSGLISFEEQGELSLAYEFLRLAEHRLQVVDERQIHSFQNREGEIRALALRMGYRDKAEKRAGTIFMEELARRTLKVRDIYDRLLMDQPAGITEKSAGGFENILSDNVSETEAVETFRLSGFHEPNRAYRNFVLLKEGHPHSPLTPRARSLFFRILPALLKGCRDAPDPDMALNNLESFISSFGSREAFYDLVTEKPVSAVRITRLFGSSEYFSRILISHPELSDALLFMDTARLKKSKDDLSAELSGALAGEFAAKMDALRSFKRAEELRIGIHDIFMEPGCSETGRELTELAEAVLEAALIISVRDMAEKHDVKDMEDCKGIAIIGFGKLGGMELIYGSDLDIIFIREGSNHPDFFDSVAERTIFALTAMTSEGTAYRIDSRLRPGGSRGMLTQSLDALKEYYASAPVWELQALTRARGIAGDRKLLAEFERIRKEILSKPRDKNILAGEIARMRGRLEREAAKVKGINIKRGPGGLMDIEFTVQYLQLLHGHKHPELLAPQTLYALDKAIEKRLVPKAEGRALRESYFFIKRLESYLRMIMGLAESVLPDDEGRLKSIALRMGYGQKGPEAAKTLIADYRKYANKVREIFDKIIS